MSVKRAFISQEEFRLGTSP